MMPLAFLNPMLLFAGLAVPLLILAYLKRRETKRYVVSSVLVLRHLSRKAVPRKKFRPPLRFFLEFLALCCLVLAAAQPVLDKKNNRVAVLFDNSLSMKAAAGDSQGSRFDAAKVEAQKWLKNQSANSLFTLFLASPRLRQQGNEEVSAGELSSTIDSLEVTYTPDVLDGAATELLESDKFDKVFIVSDKQVDLEGKPAGLESRMVGAPKPNVSLSGVRIEQEGFETSTEKLIATVAYAGGGSGSVPVSLTYVSPEGTEGAAQSGTAALKTSGITEVEFKLPGKSAENGFWKIAISAGAGDALPDDNVAFVSAAKTEQSGILLVSDNNTRGTLGLERLPEVAVTLVSPTEFSKLSSDDLKKYILLVFHGTAPVRFPEVPMLVVVPPVANPLFPAKSEVSSPRISSWQSEHPITSYLRVPLLTPTASVVFRDNNLVKPVIRSEEGPVLLAGEGRGVRYAVLGFEIFPFEGASTPVTSVLTLNLFGWLRGGVEIGGERRTGGTLPFNEQSTRLVRILGAESKKFRELPQQNSLELLYPGGYVFEEKASKSKKLVGVNLFHPEESNTFVTQTIALSNPQQREAVEAPRGLPLWTYLAWTALALILLESLLALRRSQEGYG